MSDFVLYHDHGKRSKHLMAGFHQCLTRIGFKVRLKHAESFKGQPEGDVAIFYGLRGPLKAVYNCYSRHSKAIFVDLGYFGRREGGNLQGYHRISINELFPYKNLFEEHDNKRSKHFNIKLEEMKHDGQYILLAGMSGKSAWANDLGTEEFEKKAIKKLKELTDMPIVYRPKPSWVDAKPLSGALYSSREQELDDVLKNTSVIVTHHSNVSIDGLILGIPSIVTEPCHASRVTSPSLEDINHPMMPSIDERQDWLNALCYQQWNYKEIMHGDWFYYFKERGCL